MGNRLFVGIGGFLGFKIASLNIASYKKTSIFGGISKTAKSTKTPHNLKLS